MPTIANIIADLETRIERNRKFVQNALDEASRAGHQNLSIATDAECSRRLDEAGIRQSRRDCV